MATKGGRIDFMFLAPPPITRPLDPLLRGLNETPNETFTTWYFYLVFMVWYHFFSFLPVHQTSMKSYSHLVSTDNKGFASFRFEREMNPGLHPGEVCVHFLWIRSYRENCEAFGTMVSFSRKMMSIWYCIVAWESSKILNNTSRNKN